MLYLVRHGRAGSRVDYDRLDTVGGGQIRAVARELVKRGVEISSVVSGTLERQRRSRDVLIATVTAAEGRPEIVRRLRSMEDPRWNELQLSALYQHYAPVLAERSSSFARDLARMRARTHSEPHATGGAVTRTDEAVLAAWVEDETPPSEIEPHADYVARIRSAVAELLSEGHPVVVVTSAGPIAVACGERSSNVTAATMCRALTVHNASLSMLGPEGVVSFDDVAHLRGEHRTLR